MDPATVPTMNSPASKVQAGSARSAETVHSPGIKDDKGPARSEETIRSPGIKDDKVDKPSGAGFPVPSVRVIQTRASRHARREEAQVKNSKPKRLCKRLSHNKRVVSEKVNEALLRKDIEKLTAQNGKLKIELKTATNQLQRLRQDSAKKIRQNQGEILSQNKIIEELKKRSSSKSGQVNVAEQLTAKPGFYSDGSATPNVLQTALSRTKAAVTWTQTLFCETGITLSSSALPHPEFFFLRSDHIGYWVKSILYDIYFEGFENQSFNTLGGVSRYLDTSIRQTKFYEYYLSECKENNAGDIEDPQFEEFYESKNDRLFRLFSVGNIVELGGPQLLSFRAAARSVWLLHKLAFSFEPPASIFRVERGADYDSNYMKPVVDCDDSEQFILKVGFMIAPGLRVSEAVMPCEFYFSTARPVPGQSESSSSKISKLWASDQRT